MIIKKRFFIISILRKYLIKFPIITDIIFKIEEDKIEDKYIIKEGTFLFINIKEINVLSLILDIIVNEKDIKNIRITFKVSLLCGSIYNLEINHYFFIL